MASTGSPSSPLSSLTMSDEDIEDSLDKIYYVAIGGSVSIFTGQSSRELFVDITSTGMLSLSKVGNYLKGTIPSTGPYYITYTLYVMPDGYEVASGMFSIRGVDTTPPEIDVTSISLSGRSSGEVGESLTITATTSPSTATNRHVVWGIESGSNNMSITSTTDTSTGGRCVISLNRAGSGVLLVSPADGGDVYKELTITISNPSYTCYLYYNANGGSGAPSTQSYTSTSTSSHTFTISSTKPSRTGYVFQGWATSSGATTASYQLGDTISVSAGGSKTLYAVWKKAAAYIKTSASAWTLADHIYVKTAASTWKESDTVYVKTSSSTWNS